MNILLTGANGFLGSYIKMAFADQNLTTLGLSDCDLNYNLASGIPVLKNSFDIVIHAAGKAHTVPRNRVEKEAFFTTNVQGTLNLLYALEQTDKLPKTFIFISTISVYGVENAANFNESAPLIGETPYASSKIKAEKLLIEWGNQHQVNMLILRLSLLVGENPPGTLGSMVKAIRKRYYFRIGEGSARRSMVLASDVAQLITKSHNKSGIYNLTDGYHPSFMELEDSIGRKYGKTIRKIPYWLALIAARAGDLFTLLPINSRLLEKISHSDTYNDNKARMELGWEPGRVLDFFV